MPYTAKNFEYLLGLPGLSDGLLKNHLALYQGYVTNFNKLNDILVEMEKSDKFGAPEYAELNRRLGWEWNGMRLHELYFENLTKTPAAPPADSALMKKIVQEFGSFELFEKDFRAMGAMRGIGWVVLYSDNAADRLFNVWIDEHNVGHLAGAHPLLVMDIFEHAYMLDYGLKRADYIETFMKQVDWEAADKRLSARGGSAFGGKD